MSPSSRHQSLTDRIRVQAADQGIDSNRLRRSVAFHRVLARLCRGALVLKGGFTVEVRLGGAARATKDLDFVTDLAAVSDPALLADLLDDLLDVELADGFSFRVQPPREVRPADALAPVWRFRLEARLDGVHFDDLVLDLVGQADEIDSGTELLEVPSPLVGGPWPPVRIEAVDVYQQAAEKFHAYSRVYAGDRPSSRVKDLVDLALLTEAGLLSDPTRLRRRLVAVHEARGGTGPPPELPLPPPLWPRQYAALVASLPVTATTVEAAYALARHVYLTALREGNAT